MRYFFFCNANIKHATCKRNQLKWIAAIQKCSFRTCLRSPNAVAFSSIIYFMICDLCTLCRDHTGAPKKLLDTGKAFLSYFEAIKKEYDVRTVG